MVAIKQKSLIAIHTKKKKEFKSNTKDSHQITREENKKGKKICKNKQKTINKIITRTYTSITMLNVNGLSALNKDIVCG